MNAKTLTLLHYYANGANAPLTAQELNAQYGDRNQGLDPIVNELLCLCKDGVIRPRKNCAEIKKHLPDCYLYVRECRSGQTWIVPSQAPRGSGKTDFGLTLRGNSTLDLERQIKKWAKSEYAGELRLDGKIMPRLEGDYYARIMTDGHPPDSIVSWESGGFYLKQSFQHLIRITKATRHAAT